MKQKIKAELLFWLKSIVFAFVVFVITRAFIFAPVLVSGESMMPTFEDGDKVIVNKMSKPLHTIDRFDVIVFKANSESDYIKRVIGLPGESVSYVNDVLFINGKAIEEPFLDKYKAELTDQGRLTQDFSIEFLYGETTIPEGHYLVLGDNRRKSMDSRDPRVGLVSEETIEGTVGIRFYPLTDIGFIK